MLHQTGQGKRNTVAQIHAGGATPPADRPQWGVRDNGDGAQLGVSLARARALVAPPSLCIFHTAIFRRRMVLARVQDWASSAAVPFDGRPQGRGHLESTARVRAEGAPDLSIRWAPVPSLEPITLRSNRPSAAAVRLDRPWTSMFRCHDNARPIRAIQYISRSERQVWPSERRVGALSGTLSCFAVTHPVPP